MYSAPVPPPAGYIITPSNLQPTRSAADTAEFRRNYGANEFVNALYALDSGHDGHGVTVAVIDDGVVNVNGELDGRIDTSLSKDFGYVTKGGVKTKRDVLGEDQSDHGTAVANIIAGNANGQGAVGYAPGARLAVLRVSDWDEDTKTEALFHAVEALDYATAQKIKIVSSSLNQGGSATWGEAVTRFGATGGLIVNSAGNSAAANPADAAAIDASNVNAIIFVGALSPNIQAYTIESYSNRAGTMKDRYVVAVGTNVTTLVNGTVGLFSGTSSATPTVAALAADILSKWPQLTGQQAGQVILTTAKDIGDPGVDDVFGHGLVDFKAALAPVNPTLSNGATQTAVRSSVMAIPTPMGAAAIQTALSNVTILDQFGRDYAASLAGLIVKPQVGADHRIWRRVAQMGHQSALSFGSFTGTMGFASARVGPGGDQVVTQATAGTIDYVSDGVGIRAAWNAADSLQTDVMGLAPFADGVLAYAPQAGTSIGVDRYLAGGRLGITIAGGRTRESAASAVTLGWSGRVADMRVSFIDEVGTLMGMPTGEGALRLGGGARTVMIEAHHGFGIAPGWSIEGYGSLGLTHMKPVTASLVTGTTPLVGSRLGFQMTGTALGGLVSLGVAQPLTIEAGAARLTYASNYDLATRSLIYQSSSASLAGQRRVQLTAGYSTGGPRSTVRIGLMQDLTDGSPSMLAHWAARF